jgi:predicted enzyme related to lactoylglutathione lyase
MATDQPGGSPAMRPTVIDHWMLDVPVAGEAGFHPYIFVPDVDATLELITAHGGAVLRAPYPEGDVWVATFSDPAGNVLGIWQSTPRNP